MKKVSLVVALITSIALLASANLSYAKDSSSGAYFVDDNGDPVSAATPSYIYGKTFVMEEGFSDPYPNSVSSGSFGYMETIYCDDETDQREAFCLVRGQTRAYTTNYDTSSSRPEICPVNFMPRFSISIQGSSPSLGKTFACPAPSGTWGSVTIPLQDRAVPQYGSNGHYWLYFITSARLRTPPGGGAAVLYPANLIRWQVSCIPELSTTATRTEQSSEYCHRKRTDDEGQRRPILLEMGISEQTPSSGNTNTIRTTKICPTNYTPYVELKMSSPSTHSSVGNDDFKVLNAFSYCLNRIQSAGGGTRYDLTVLMSSTTTRIQKSSSSLTVNDPVRDDSNVFLNVQWSLYCYSPGVPPPHNYVTSPGGPGNACTTSQQPYAP